jgi:hypothetical protein
MTEAEWLACDDPRPMLKWLRGKASDRKRRLLAVGCCRRIWKDIRMATRRRAVEVAEQFADGTAGANDLRAALLRATAGGRFDRASFAACWSASDKSRFVERVPFEAAKHVASRVAKSRSSARGRKARDEELSAQAALVRDVFGNPFRLVALGPAWPAWDGGTVPKLAQAIYDDRAFERLPVLADALEEAGCTNPDLLGHCRQPAEHVRGCWAVDLLLGKS